MVSRKGKEPTPVLFGVRLNSDAPLVQIEFESPLKYLELSPDQADQLAVTLQHAAREMRVRMSRAGLIVPQYLNNDGRKPH